MAHSIITKEDFIQCDTKKRIENRERAELNKREYPDSYKQALPPGLRELIPRLITYPREDSIVADDFLPAIKKDLKL
jgi:hypothetical protein